MDIEALIFACFFIVIILVESLAVRYGKLSAKKAAVVFFSAPFLIILMIQMVFGGNLLQVLCMGALISIGSAPISYLMYRHLERRAEQNNDTSSY